MLFVALAAVALFSACDLLASPSTSLMLVNNANDPFHPNGGAKLEQGASMRFGRLGHGYAKAVRLERMGSTWATVTITSMYPTESKESYAAVITITEAPYGTFHASSDNSNIDVSVANR
jgi:hypothetical protein